MKIFFDFDGTLIDSSERLYKLFCTLIPECKLTKKEYWDLKRNKINHQMILEKYFCKYDYDEFNKKWLSLIETEKYLNYNKIFSFTKPLLQQLYEKYSLYLLTSRQSKKNLMQELQSMDIKKYFTEIFVTENKKTKIEILKEQVLLPEDILVGDTGKDIQTAQEAGIQSVAVTNGFMSEEKLREYKPDFIISDVSLLNLCLEQIESSGVIKTENTKNKKYHIQSKG